MPTATYRTNPTGLIRIERTRVAINASRNGDSRITAFTLSKCEVADLGLPQDCNVAAIAYSGFEEKRVELGTVGNVVLPGSVDISDLDGSNLVVRIIVRAKDSYRLVAACEGIRPKADEESDRTPLLAVEYDDLSERMWELKATSGAPPILRVSNNAELDLRKHFETKDPLIRGLIIPQAFEQALSYLVYNQPADSDPARWQNVWKTYVESKGRAVPSLPEDDDDREAVSRWAKETADALCEEVRFVTQAVNEKKDQP